MDPVFPENLPRAKVQTDVLIMHLLCAKGEGYGIPLHHPSISTATRTAAAVVIFMRLLEKRQQRFP